MNDFTRHFGDFDRVGPEDDADLAAEKARQLHNDANGDLHMASTPFPGVKSDIEVGPIEAGNEEYDGTAGNVFDANHTSQEALLKVNSGSTTVTKEADHKLRQDQEDKRKDNSVLRFMAASGIAGLTASQAIAYNRFADLLERRQQVADQMQAAERDVEVAMAVNADALTTGTEEERVAAALAILDSTQGVQIQIMEQERLDAELLPQLGNLAQQFGSDTAPADTEVPSDMTAAEIEHTGQAFLAADADSIDLSTIENLPEPVQALLIEARYPGALESLPSGSEMSPVEFMQSQIDAGTAPEPSAPINQVCEIPEAMSPVLAEATAVIEEATGMTPLELQAQQLISGNSRDPLLAPSDEVRAAATDPMLGNNGGLTALESPGDHASTAAYMGFDQNNGVLADGAFNDARIGPTPTDPMLTPTDPMLGNNGPNANSQPLPGTPEHMELRMRDPLLAAGGL